MLNVTLGLLGFVLQILGLLCDLIFKHKSGVDFHTFKPWLKWLKYRSLKITFFIISEVLRKERSVPAETPIIRTRVDACNYWHDRTVLYGLHLWLSVQWMTVGKWTETKIIIEPLRIWFDNHVQQQNTPDDLKGNLTVHKKVTAVSLPIRKVYDRNDLKVPCCGGYVRSDQSFVLLCSWPPTDCSIPPHYAAIDICANLTEWGWVSMFWNVHVATECRGKNLFVSIQNFEFTGSSTNNTHCVTPNKSVCSTNQAKGKCSSRRVACTVIFKWSIWPMSTSVAWNTVQRCYQPIQIFSSSCFRVRNRQHQKTSVSVLVTF